MWQTISNATTMPMISLCILIGGTFIPKYLTELQKRVLAAMALWFIFLLAKRGELCQIIVYY